MVSKVSSMSRISFYKTSNLKQRSSMSMLNSGHSEAFRSFLDQSPDSKAKIPLLDKYSSKYCGDAFKVSAGFAMSVNPITG